MSDRDPEFADFAPERLSTGRRRRVDPLVVGVAVVALGLGLAVAKPWETQVAAPAVASPAPDVAVAASDAPAAVAPVPAGDPLVTWPEVAAISRFIDAWGARQIVRTTPADGVDPALHPVWAGAETSGSGVDLAVLPPADGAVVALGISHPATALPLDARIWVDGGEGVWGWLDARRLDPSPWGGALMFTPPVRDGIQLPGWPTGRYRVEILVDGDVRLLDIDVRAPSVVAETPAASAAPPVRGAFAADVSDLLPGPFLSVDGAAIPFPAVAVAAELVVDRATAWLTPASSSMTVLREPRAGGVGVMFPPGATDADATIRSAGPEALTDEPNRAVRIRIEGRGRAPYVVFSAPGGLAWPSGTFEMVATWRDGSAERSATYRFELVPSGASEPLALAAARVFSGAADAPTSDQVAVRVGDLSCDRDDGPSVREPAFIGVDHPLGRPPTDIALRLEQVGGGTVAQPILTAREVIPGLSMIGPRDRAAFTPGVYRLEIGSGARAERLLLCVGVDAATR